MKNLLLLALISLTSLLYSQETTQYYDSYESGSWIYTKAKSDFNGFWEAAATIGKGQFPYTSPVLAVRYKDGRLDVVLTKVATSIGKPLSIELCFDSGEVLYYEAGSFNGDDVWYIAENDDTIKEIINNIKTSTKVSVRIDNGYKQHMYSFSLNGSTGMINKINKKQ